MSLSENTPTFTFLDVKKLSDQIRDLELEKLVLQHEIFCLKNQNSFDDFLLKQIKETFSEFGSTETTNIK